MFRATSYILMLSMVFYPILSELAIAVLGIPA